MKHPLVSVVVLSYNAEKSIVETLDSIKSQTYSPLELIIADDCSKDDTAIKCKEWLAVNQNRFTRTQLIVNEENKGIPANLNIGIRASSGEWIKSFGDDILLPNAIEQYIDFIADNDCNIVFSRMSFFSDETREEMQIRPKDDYRLPVSNHEQYLAQIQNKLGTNSPTWFYKRELYDRLGGFDEHFRLFDDLPFAHKILESGDVFSYMPKLTVLYRVTNTSVSNSRKLTGEQKRASFESRYAVYRELQVPALKKYRLWGALLNYDLAYFFQKKKIYSRDNSLARYFYGAFSFVFYKLLDIRREN